MTDPERITDNLAKAIEHVRTGNRLEAMWSPELLNPEIPLTDEELDEFLKTFARNDQGERLETWIKGGAICEANHENDQGVNERCTATAVGSVDFYGVTFSDSVLVCREDVRFVYDSIKTKDLGKQGMELSLTINGKAIPTIPPEERVA